MPVLRGTNAIIADEVTAALAAASLSIHLDPVRAYLPTLEFTDAGVLHCTVLPRHRTFDIDTQADNVETHTIDVVLQQRLSPNDSGEYRGEIANEEVDPLLYLAEEICDLLLRWRAVGVDAVCTAAGSNIQDKAINALYEPSDLKTLHQVTVVITLRFMVHR